MAMFSASVNTTYCRDKKVRALPLLIDPEKVKYCT
jgi:hypothetical protein